MLTVDTSAVRAYKQALRRVGKWLESLPKETANDLCDLFQMYAKAKEDGDEEELEKVNQAIREILLPDSLKDGVNAKFFDEQPNVRARLDAYRAKVGLEIKKRREKLRMTQAELAEKAGIPQSHVSRLECGKHVPTHITMEKIARALKTKPSRLDPGFIDDDE
ncbi:MAG TPA: helix-turn-helix transcriptional regulator [Pirellulales bacterium]|jgi:DNA-binding XRE family transcriptional regulator|nr:helix-turn-helix transcriptional regulator [Pirellulales bacterium]